MRFVLLGTLFLLTMLAGCGTGVEPRHPVSGSVSLDGAPIAEGEIYLIGDGAAPTILPIKAGAFAGETTAGAKRVQIYAYKDVPEHESPSMPGYTVPATRVNTMPAQFNTQSQLKANIAPNQPNVLELKLTSR